jgi:hypothetical protein
MIETGKPIRLSGHAHDQLQFGGGTEIEVVAAIRAEPCQPADLNRLECRRDFLFDAEWNGKHYAIKQVRPIFVDEISEIVVVTVYVYYF